MKQPCFPEDAKFNYVIEDRFQLALPQWVSAAEMSRIVSAATSVIVRRMNRGEGSMVLQTERIGQQPRAPGAGKRTSRCILDPVRLVLRRDHSVLDRPLPSRDRLSQSSCKVVCPIPHEGRCLSLRELSRTGMGSAPYISPDILAMVLQYFLPIDVVGRCILSLCIILVAYATYFFLKKACPENVGLASFGILVAFNPNFLMGSISNEFSLAFCLLVVGLWVSYCKDPKVMTAVGIAVGLLLVYLSHLSGFVVAGLVMGVYALFQEQRWKKLGILAVLSLPPLLILDYSPIHAGSGASFVYATAWDKLKNLFFPVRLYTSKILDLIVWPV